MGIIEVATVIPITMTIIDTKITISIMRRLRRLPEGGAGSLNRWVAFFNGSKSRFRSWIIITFFFDTSGSLIVAQCSRIYSYAYVLHLQFTLIQITLPIFSVWACKINAG